MLGSNLAKYQLAAWAENPGNLKLRLSNKVEEKNKQKQCGGGVRHTIKMT